MSRGSRSDETKSIYRAASNFDGCDDCDKPNWHDILTGSRPDGTAFSPEMTCKNWTSSAQGSAMLPKNRIGLLAKSFNERPPRHPEERARYIFQNVCEDLPGSSDSTQSPRNRWRHDNAKAALAPPEAEHRCVRHKYQSGSASPLTDTSLRKASPH